MMHLDRPPVRLQAQRRPPMDASDCYIPKILTSDPYSFLTKTPDPYSPSDPSTELTNLRLLDLTPLTCCPPTRHLACACLTLTCPRDFAASRIDRGKSEVAVYPWEAVDPLVVLRRFYAAMIRNAAAPYSHQDAPCPKNNERRPERRNRLKNTAGRPVE